MSAAAPDHRAGEASGWAALTAAADGATASTCSTDHLIVDTVPSRCAMMAAMAGATEMERLRVMTWNLWWRFGPFEQRFPAIVDTIRSVDPDVLCLQEVWSDGADDQAADLAAALAMHVVRTEAAVNGNSFGNAVLARWPITPLGSEALPDAAGRTSHRRVVAGLVDTPRGPWPVASTHLDYPFDGSATRQAQVDRLLELTVTWRGDPAIDPPLILGADLNAVPDSDEVRTLTGRRPGISNIVFSDAWEQCGDGDGLTWRSENPHIVHSAWPNRRIDYLLVSWPRPKPLGNPMRAWLAGTGPVEVDGTSIWPSDHVAVVAEFAT